MTVDHDALPGWLEPLPDAEEQRALDRWAIEELGIPGIELMERAGRGLATLVAEQAPEGMVVVVCGKGNNGGDGLVCARVLRERGREVRVLTLADPQEYQGDARTNLERLPGDGPQGFEPQSLTEASAVVDAMLGTGFAGAPREPVASAIDAINGCSERAAVIACDVPSGVNGSSGEIAGEAVLAAATATFHAGKPGLWIAPGKAHAGTVHTVDIGIPAGGPARASVGLIERGVLDAIPRRGSDSTKFSAGQVLVCGGSTGLTGAPCMASEAAMRAGAGYVTALVPGSLDPIFETLLLEVMTVPLADDGGTLTSAAGDEVLERCARADALVLGPGLGRARETFQLARTVARSVSVPLVLDADGLNAHANQLEVLSGRTAATVLTPHAGELARLLGNDSSEVAAHRLKAARSAAAAAAAIVVLKGDDTLVVEPGGRAAVNRGGTPALATAGTGDVLSGVIAALVAKRVDTFTATCGAVFAHSAAGRLAAQEIGPEGVIASDVIARLPAALQGQGA
ncbi:MAG TPA: NAD(P)H-hydrate dehydratase [Solirubrobacteraceae bacterium]|nr:NAD(P)H-hydrate dehydratase [Solirubrobacteraceae bacterium]